MNRDKFKKEAVEIMNENVNQSMPKEFKKYFQNLPLSVTNKNGTSSRTMNIFSSGKHALITITHKYETEDKSNDEIITEAFERMMTPLPPQCKKLFKYDGYWRDVKDSKEYDFVKRLELIRGTNGYVLYTRFD